MKLSLFIKHLASISCIFLATKQTNKQKKHCKKRIWFLRSETRCFETKKKKKKTQIETR